MFFFTSKRLHTIYIGDWSSDVCSSDLPSVEGREQDGDGVCEVRVRVRVLGRIVNHEREDEPLACGTEEVAGKRRGRAERAGLGADVSLRGRALHAVAQRAVHARYRQSLAEDCARWMSVHVCEELECRVG